jgi:hypothetical protein
MPPSQIFVSTRSRRQYPRRRSSAPIVPLSLLLAVALVAWALAVLVLWWGV